MSIQPYKGSDLIVVEKRDADGKLDFSGEQAPPGYMTFDELYKLYFRENPEGDTASADDLQAWLKGKGWTTRAKTW